MTHEMTEEEVYETYGKYGLDAPRGTVKYVVWEQADNFGVKRDHPLMKKAKEEIEKRNPDGSIPVGTPRSMARNHAEVARYGDDA